MQENIEAYEYSGELLNKVAGVFFNLSECENSDEMEAIAEEVTPLLSAHGDNIALNAKLFARIKTVYDPSRCACWRKRTKALCVVVPMCPLSSRHVSAS